MKLDMLQRFMGLITACLFMAGCVTTSGPPEESGPLVSASLPVLPLDHEISFEVTLGPNEWKLWLWVNDRGSAAFDDVVGYKRGLSARPVAGGADPYWIGAFTIAAAVDPVSGEVAYMSERAPPVLQYVTNDWLGAQGRSFLDEETGMRAGSASIEGVLLFSQAPVTLTYATAAGSGTAHDAPRLAANGTDLVVAEPALSAEEDFSQFERVTWQGLDVAPGFVVGGRAYDHRMHQGGILQYNYTLVFPDGEERTRTFERTWSRLTRDDCFPRDPVVSTCRVGWSGHIELMDYTNSCQPPAPVSARMETRTSSPTVRVVPVLFNVPFDYCSWFGATWKTPHPCVDMTSDEFVGCPD